MSIWNSLVASISPSLELAKGSNASDFDSVAACLSGIKHPASEAYASVRSLVLCLAGGIKMEAKSSKSGAERISGASSVRKAIAKLKVSDDKSENKERVRALVAAYDVGSALNWAIRGDRSNEVGFWGNE